MSFDKRFMAPVAGFGTVGPRLWMHINTETASGNSPANQAAVSYFDAALADFDIQVGDFIIAGEDEAGGAADVGMVGVISIVSGVVTTDRMLNPI